MKVLNIVLASSCLQAAPGMGHVLKEHILSTVIYTRYGDRTPYILPEPNTLTPLGATQMYHAGNRFRNRYLMPTLGDRNTVIQDISQFQLDNDQVWTMSLPDQFIVASAQAFLQGLYPPLQASSNVTFTNGQSQLANGSNVISPLNGYQYPQIYTASELDLNSIWLMGANNCPIYIASRNEYFYSALYENLLDNNSDFYRSLQPALLNGIFANSSVNYLNAYRIFDYLNYGSIHNSSFVRGLSFEDWVRAKILADNWIWATCGNTSAFGLTEGDHIRAIAGRTLANRIVQALYDNINSSGLNAKMTLLFGSFEPMVSFAALAGLASEQNPQFRGVPEYGSSMVFELYSLTENQEVPYPSTDGLRVRFFFQNGTDESSELVAYPLFGNGPSQISMTLNEFVASMQMLMISNAADWCRTCASYSIFCPAMEVAGGTGRAGLGRHRPRKGLRPVVAGAIGAVVTLATFGLLIAAAILFGGARLYRKRTKRMSELNGFKGGEKLASDQDLTIPKGGPGVSVAATGATPGNGHERVGSWELRDQKPAVETQLSASKSSTTPMRGPSFEEDDLQVSPFADPVRPNDRV